MPIYEYCCDACGHAFDALQKMSDAPLKACPACDKAELRKLVSAPSFRLKGNGWYETDFKNNGKKKPDDKSSASTAESGSNDGAKKSDSSKGADKTTAAATD